MATTHLKKEPNYTLVRSGTGAVAVDSNVISLANFPAANGFDPKNSREIAVVWNATGAVASDMITIEVLHLTNIDAGVTEGTWVRGAVVEHIPPNTIAVLPVGSNNVNLLRVHEENVNVATDLRIYAAQNDPQ